MKWTRRHAAHLLSRAGFGGRPEEIEVLVKLGAEKAALRLIQYDKIDERISPPSWLLSPWVDTEKPEPNWPREKRTQMHVQTRLRYRKEAEALKLWWIERMAKTKRPLQEKLTLFWSGHFATALDKIFISQLHYELNDYLRQNASGSFRALAQGVTVHPTMMSYLDSQLNAKEHPNENYARELMELFTLGIGNYTEKDIQEAARSLSGWTLEGITPRFVAARHDDGSKTIFGKTGKFNAADVVDLCVYHPRCAPFLCGKLAHFFGVEDPALHARLTAKLARALEESGYELRPVLFALFTSPEFYHEKTMGQQIKSPVQLLVGTLRLLEMEGKPTPPLTQALAQMGQDLFNPPNVKGWVQGRDMITTSTLLVRYQVAGMLLDNQMPAGFGPLAPERRRVIRSDESQTRGLSVSNLISMDSQERSGSQRLELRWDRRDLVQAKTVGELTERLTERLLVAPASPRLKSAILTACSPLPEEQRLPAAIRLILSSPEYQLA